MSEQCLVDQAYFFCLIRWIAKVEIEELQKKLVEGHGPGFQQVKSVDDPVNKDNWEILLQA